MRWLGLAAIVCSACATSYSDATSHRSLGHGMYIITADGNGFTSRSLISIYMYRRAGEICSSGFDLIESDRSSTISRTTLGAFTFPSGALAIECRTSRGAIAGAEAGALEEPRKVIADQRPIYCTAAVRDPDVGTCWLAAEKCASARDAEISDGSAHTPCAPAKAAACFNAVRVLDDARVTRCAPTITGCQAQLAALRRNPDYTVSADECGLYRVVPATSSTTAPVPSQPSDIVDPFPRPQPSNIVDPF